MVPANTSDDEGLAAIIAGAIRRLGDLSKRRALSECGGRDETVQKRGKEKGGCVSCLLSLLVLPELGIEHADKPTGLSHEVAKAAVLCSDSRRLRTCQRRNCTSKLAMNITGNPATSVKMPSTLPREIA
ncbi:hypothetical protein SAMN04487768_2278 [Burkholderia sp. b13]|nr:hypothetical protein SAMN04487768_2278 [Burkholderia sp. b13]